jgi:hypothetical protein
MTALIAPERDMATRRQRAKPEQEPKPRRDDMAVKVERILAEKAKTIATRRGVTMAEYLSDLIRTAVERDFTKVVREMEEKR